MAQIVSNGVKISSILACMPSTLQNNLKNSIFYSIDDAQKFIDFTGVKSHYITDSINCISQLSYKSIIELLKN